jgi:hypothetical protein
MRTPPNKPGHLKTGDLHLVQTEQSRRALSRGSRQYKHFEKVKPVELNWKRKIAGMA